MMSTFFRFFRCVRDAYFRQLHCHPYRTNAISTMLVVGSGDFFAQTLEKRNHSSIHRHHHRTGQSQPFDDVEIPHSISRIRLLVMASWGAPFSIIFTSWFRFFEKTRWRTANLPNTVVKVVFTSILAVPINALFFVYSTTLEHIAAQTIEKYKYRQLRVSALDMRSPKPHAHEYNISETSETLSVWIKLGNEIATKFRERFIRVMIGSWIFWTPANMINFGLIPIHFRVLFSSMASVCWNTFLSIVSHAADECTTDAHYNSNTEKPHD